VKPGQKVSSPFDLPILLIAQRLMLKKGKKGINVHGKDDDSIILLSEKDTPLKKTQLF
jgi:hypothetical protein